jgi:hypothetical protein
VRVGCPASWNLTPNEVADTNMGASLLALSVWGPLVNDAMLDTDGLGRVRPCTCGVSGLVSDVTNSDGTVCELSARFEDLTFRVGGGSGVYVVQRDAMINTHCTKISIGYALGDLEPWEAQWHSQYMLFQFPHVVFGQGVRFRDPGRPLFRKKPSGARTSNAL